MESKKRVRYVDTKYLYQKGESVEIREPDWVPRIRPRFKKIYREDLNEQKIIPYHP